MSGSSFDRPGGKNPDGATEKRKSLRQIVTEVDVDILKLLARRYNLLEKMRHKGRLDPAEEKFIREAWQNSVTRFSRDPQLSGRFFSLMQELTFLPRPEGPKDGENLSGGERRQAFNLAPSKSPVKIDLRAPLASRATRAWIYLAAAAGGCLRLQPALQNDMEVDFENALQRMGAKVSYVNDVAEVAGGAPLGWPDASIFVGDSDFNFYLLLAHYLGHTSKARFDGGPAMKLADFSPLRGALTGLGARMTHVVPKSQGLPCRVECSGLLPPVYKADKKAPPQFCEALILAASFYEAPFAIDLSAQPLNREIFARVLPILESSGASFVLDGETINLQPASLSISATPDLPIDDSLAAYLLALAVPNGGEVELLGRRPPWGALGSLLNALARNGMDAIRADGSTSLNLKGAPREFIVADDDLASFAPRQLPLLCALGACVALSGGKASLPSRIIRNNDAVDFFRACGVVALDDGTLGSFPQKGLPPVWNAPGPWWALALAIAAGARKGVDGFQLGNAGVITQIWPRFWFLYNNLPRPDFQKLYQEQPAPKEKGRRRILTEVVAVPPEIKEEDWER